MRVFFYFFIFIYIIMKKYINFIQEQFEIISSNEKGKLLIEPADDESSEWKMTLTLKKTWEQYINKSITLIDFNNIYASTLIENQQQISEKCGDAAWTTIEPIVVDELRKATNIIDSEKIYNKLYDIFDKYEIFIDTGNIEEVFENSMDQQKYSVGDIVIVDFFGKQETAKITKINTKNSILIQIEQNTIFLPKEHEIKIDAIIGVVSTNESPATVSDWNQPLKQKPSNDFVINGNGSPGVPAPGVSLK